MGEHSWVRKHVFTDKDKKLLRRGILQVDRFAWTCTKCCAVVNWISEPHPNLKIRCDINGIVSILNCDEMLALTIISD